MRIVGAKSVQLIVLVVGLGYGFAAFLHAIGGPEQIQAEWGSRAILVFIPMHAVLAVSPIPSEILALTYGAMFGFVPATCIAWAGWMLAAWMEYALFRRASTELRGIASTDRVPAWLKRFPVTHPVFLIAGRWVPFGSHLVNATAGARRVPLWRFTWATALSLIPISVIVARAGAEFGARFG